MFLAISLYSAHLVTAMSLTLTPWMIFCDLNWNRSETSHRSTILSLDRGRRECRGTMPRVYCIVLWFFHMNLNISVIIYGSPSLISIFQVSLTAYAERNKTPVQKMTEGRGWISAWCPMKTLAFFWQWCTGEQTVAIPDVGPHSSTHSSLSLSLSLPCSVSTLRDSARR